MTKHIYACPVNHEQVKRSDSLAKMRGNPEEHSFIKINKKVILKTLHYSI